jgi:hypothetical protein
MLYLSTSIYVLEVIHPCVLVLHFYFVFSLPELFGVEEATNPITGLHEKDQNLKAITQRNIQLYNRFRNRTCTFVNDCNESPRHAIEMKRIGESRKNLPIAEFR